MEMQRLSKKCNKSVKFLKIPVLRGFRIFFPNYKIGGSFHAVLSLSDENGWYHLQIPAPEMGNNGNESGFLLKWETHRLRTGMGVVEIWDQKG